MNKVLVYARQLLPYSQTFVREQVCALRSWHPVLIGESRARGGLELDGVETTTLRSTPSSRAEGLVRRAYALAGFHDAGLLNLLRAQEAALLHVHFGTEAALVWPTIRQLDVPIFITLHGYDINTMEVWWRSGRGGLQFLRYPQTLRRLAEDPRVRFIAVSEAIRQRAIDFGLPSDKVFVHFIGVDVLRLKRGPIPLARRPPRVLFVGRQVEKKNCAALIRAYGLVRQHLPAAELVVVGDGPLLSRHRALAADLNLPVRFAGALSPAAVLQQLHQARVFCLPSITAANGDAEGLPISILEAQACGVPVITSASGGAAEGIAEGETGFCVDAATPEALAERIVLLLTDGERAAAMGIAARTFVETKFDLAACTARLEALYDEAISENG